MGDAMSAVELKALREPRVALEDVLDLVPNEDLMLAIMYLEKREKSWQDYLSMPST